VVNIILDYYYLFEIVTTKQYKPLSSQEIQKYKTSEYNSKIGGMYLLQVHKVMYKYFFKNTLK